MVPWKLRVIRETPLTELWNDHGPVPATRVRDLTVDDIASLLRNGSVQFMVAAVGRQPHWIPPEWTVSFWKNDVKDRLLGQFVYTEDIPAAGGYWAQEWRRIDNDSAVVVLTLVS